MNDKRSDRRGGFYWSDGRPYVSVTTVLQAIDKPALRRWVGKEVYLAMVKTPTLSEAEALGAPYKTSDKAKARGTTIHSIVEAYKKNGIKISPELEQFKGYAQAFHKWVGDYEMHILENEKTIISKSERYAGTCDLLLRNYGRTLKDDKTGKFIKRMPNIWLVDVKTGKDIYDEAFLQLSAYKHALEENGEKVDRAGVLLLQENGNYKFAESEDYFEYFLATKKLWEFLNREDCKKIGYESSQTLSG